MPTSTLYYDLFHPPKQKAFGFPPRNERYTTATKLQGPQSLLMTPPALQTCRSSSTSSMGRKLSNQIYNAPPWVCLPSSPGVTIPSIASWGKGGLARGTSPPTSCMLHEGHRHWSKTKPSSLPSKYIRCQDREPLNDTPARQRKGGAEKNTLLIDYSGSSVSSSSSTAGGGGGPHGHVVPSVAASWLSNGQGGGRHNRYPSSTAEPITRAPEAVEAAEEIESRLPSCHISKLLSYLPGL